MLSRLTPNPRKRAGFTLLEALVVVTIIGILAAIAYPSYVQQVRKSKRTVAKSALLDAANREEQNFFSQHSYTALMYSSAPGTSNLRYASDPAYFGDDGTNLPDSTNAVYAVTATSVVNGGSGTCGSATAPCFQLQAAPLNDQTNDTGCGTFIVTSNSGGNLDKTTSTASADCWQQ